MTKRLPRRRQETVQYYYHDSQGAVRKDVLEQLCTAVNTKEELLFSDENVLYEGVATGAFHMYQVQQKHFEQLDLRARDELFLAQQGIGPADRHRAAWGIERGFYTREAFDAAVEKGKMLRAARTPQTPVQEKQLSFTVYRL